MEQLAPLPNIVFDIPGEVALPQWTVKTSAINDFLKIARIVSTTGRDVISKAVHFKPYGDKILMVSTDGDVHIKTSTDAIPNPTPLTESINIPTEVLSNLLKLSYETFSIRRVKPNRYEAVYPDGSIPFDIFSFPDDKFNLVEMEESIGNTTSIALSNFIKQSAPIISASILPHEKRALINDKGAFVSHIATLLRGNIFSSIPFDFKMRDMNIVKSLLPDKDEKVIFGKHGKNRFYVCGPNFQYSFMASFTQLPERLLKSYEDIVAIDAPFMNIPKNRLHDLADISANLMSSVGLLGIQIELDGFIVEFRNKNNEIRRFKLPGTCTSASIDTQVHAKLISLVLSAFVGEESVNITIGDKGIIIKTDSLFSVIFPQ